MASPDRPGLPPGESGRVVTLTVPPENRPETAQGVPCSPSDVIPDVAPAKLPFGFKTRFLYRLDAFSALQVAHVDAR